METHLITQILPPTTSKTYKKIANNQWEHQPHEQSFVKALMH